MGKCLSKLKRIPPEVVYELPASPLFELPAELPSADLHVPPSFLLPQSSTLEVNVSDVTNENIVAPSKRGAGDIDKPLPDIPTAPRVRSTAFQNFINRLSLAKTRESRIESRFSAVSREDIQDGYLQFGQVGVYSLPLLQTGKRS